MTDIPTRRELNSLSQRMDVLEDIIEEIKKDLRVKARSIGTLDNKVNELHQLVNKALVATKGNGPTERE